MESPRVPRMKDKVIRLGKPEKELVKAHGNAELKKGAKNA